MKTLPITAERAGRCSSIKTSIQAEAAVQARGLPPNVELWMLGFGSRTFQIFEVDMKQPGQKDPTAALTPTHAKSIFV